MVPSNERWLVKRTFIRTDADGEVKIVAGISHLRGNAHPYFSVTSENGCEHKRIAKLVPELAPVIAMHLCDHPSGEPMLAVANGMYHAAEGRVNEAARSLNVDVSDPSFTVLLNLAREEKDPTTDPAGQKALANLRAMWAKRAAEAEALLRAMPKEAEQAGTRLGRLCARKGVTCDARCGENKRSVPPDTIGWRVTMKYQGRSMTCDFFTGHAHTGVSAEDVLSCLINDAMSYENASSVESWADDMGMPLKDAKPLWKRVERIVPQLHKLLGEDFDTFARAC